MLEDVAGEDAIGLSISDLRPNERWSLKDIYNSLNELVTTVNQGI